MFAILFITNCSPINDTRHYNYKLMFAAKECNWSTVRLLLCVCPFMFSVAHLHHFVEQMRQGFTMAQAASSVLVQATYTGIFGFIAVVLFARTGNIVAPILSHMICNFVGLPDLGFMVRPRQDDDKSASYHRMQVPEYAFMYRYRYLHLVLHALGLILFAFFLFPLTADLAQHSIYWKHLLVRHH
jgi:membrane protease YdiL (CAAX protease family)